MSTLALEAPASDTSVSAVPTTDTVPSVAPEANSPTSIGSIVVAMPSPANKPKRKVKSKINRKASKTVASRQIKGSKAKEKAKRVAYGFQLNFPEVPFTKASLVSSKGKKYTTIHQRILKAVANGVIVMVGHSRKDVRKGRLNEVYVLAGTASSVVTEYAQKLASKGGMFVAVK